ncbi:MAG: COG4223 family protein [Bdellovibrionales bacterium]
MTDDSPPAPSEADNKSKGGWLIAGLAVLALAALGVVDWFGLRPLSIQMPRADDALAARVRQLEEKVQRLDGAMDALAARGSAPEAETPPQSARPADAAPSHDLSSLKEAFEGLRAKTGAAETAAARTDARAQAAFAAAIAFVQLRGAVFSGHGYAQELTAMRRAVGDSSAYEAPLSALDKHAERGVADMAALRKTFIEQTAPAEHALAKARAENWWQRLLAEFKGLVSIRRLQAPAAASGSLQIMNDALGRADLAAALDEMKNLPQEAQAALEGWRQQADARQSAGNAIDLLSRSLIGEAGKTVSPEAP